MTTILISFKPKENAKNTQKPGPQSSWYASSRKYAIYCCQAVLSSVVDVTSVVAPLPNTGNVVDQPRHGCRRVFTPHQHRYIVLSHLDCCLPLSLLGRQHQGMDRPGLCQPSPNSWSPTGMSTLTHPLQHISGMDHDRCLRRS